MSENDKSPHLSEAAAVFASAPSQKMMEAHELIGAEAALAKIMFPQQVLTDKHMSKAENLITRFGSLAGVINASAVELNREGVDMATFYMFQAVNATMLHVLKAEIEKGPLIDSWDALTDYLTATMAHKTQEHFKILFLDRKNNLIADENQSLGTVDHVPVYPREVVKRALELNASAIILAHNHPSGNPQPSKEDIAMTKQIVDACETVGITVHDHTIVGHNGLFKSFKSLGLM
ncbi:MAG: DNA repair protein RadC [Pseudomonadota bacterium]